MEFLQSVRQTFFPTRKTAIDTYLVRAVTAAAELAYAERLPIEIQYVLAVRPSRFETFRKLLESGYGLGVRIRDTTPERVLAAVDRISRESQENTVIPWLEHLLRTEESPVCSTEDLERARANGVDLLEEVRVILEQRFEFVKIVLVDLHNRGVDERQQQLMRDVNEDLYPLAIDTIVHRVIFDNAHTRTEIAQSILKALLIIGPISHVLEGVLTGLGKVFAASADDLLSETAELFALRGSGFTWRQLASRSFILVPVFVLAVYGAFQVGPLIQADHLVEAGVVFGLSAVALSLTTAFQSIGLFRRSFLELVRQGKLRLGPGQSLLRLTLRQDFTNPARRGLFIGAFFSPIVASIVFFTVPHLSSNGWVLALLGSVESIVAGISVLLAARIARMQFLARVRRALRNVVSGAITRQGV